MHLQYKGFCASFSLNTIVWFIFSLFTVNDLSIMYQICILKISTAVNKCPYNKKDIHKNS